MDKNLVQKKSDEIVQKPEDHEVEVINPLEKAFPFISFHYSCREISFGGGRTSIRSHKQSFENGKFKAEEFEGTLPGSVYFNMVGEMQKVFFHQLSALMKPFFMLLPSASKDKEK